MLPLWGGDLDGADGVRVATDACRALADGRALDADEIVVVMRRPFRAGALAGPGAAGAGRSDADVVLFADPSRPWDLLELPRALRLMRARGADVVSAYRHDRMGEGPSRALASWLWDRMVGLLTGSGIRDVAFPFNLCRMSALDRFDLLSDSPFLHTELIVRAQRHGLRVIQIGIDSARDRRTARRAPRRRRGPRYSTAACVILMTTSSGEA